MSLPLSDHFNGKVFHQPHHGQTRLRDFWRWRLTARPKRWPASVPLPPQLARPVPREGEVTATWLGHATFLLESRSGHVLTDPVFAERTSPVRWAGPRRVHPPPIALSALPRIDVVLVSHDHYDHCDLSSLAELAGRNPEATFVGPLRQRDLFEKAGARNIIELDWWESHRCRPNIGVTLTPTKHWSNRLGTPRNYRLWGGFYLHFGSAEQPIRDRDSKIENPAARRIWFVGDSGYDAAIFQAVREHCGPPDLALVPIGAYEPRWFMAPMHMNPAEAVQLHREVGATRSIAMHWGTFQLTDEGREEPVEALADARRVAGVDADAFRIANPGETAVIRAPAASRGDAGA